MIAPFTALLTNAQTETDSQLAISLAPTLDKLPFAILRHDEPLLPFGKAVIDATRDLVCAYVFHLGAYLALGAAGAVALERTIAYVPRTLVRVLHGPFANGEYVRAVYEDGFGANAATLAPRISTPDAAAYLKQPDHAVFFASSDTNKAHAFRRRFPGQIGTYINVGSPTKNHLIPFEAPGMMWRWGEAVYTSRRDDWVDTLRETVIALREAARLD